MILPKNSGIKDKSIHCIKILKIAHMSSSTIKKRGLILTINFSMYNEPKNLFRIDTNYGSKRNGCGN
jgi:hypothetical protein